MPHLFRFPLVSYLFFQAFAPALRSLLSGGDDQVQRFAKLQTADLCAAVDASTESLKQQLGKMHSSVKTATEATLKLQEDVDKDPMNKKFSSFKAAGGTIDDFFSGLEDRIGEHVGVFCSSAVLTRVCQAPPVSISKKRCVRSTQRVAAALSPSRPATTR